ncbi:MAG: N-acetylmuramoyl-L-alanine amidase [Lachnospiraceae bacterium]|nr:N-acetylmuramoyl-L-alanine amidase [Lachnospiraceae bacterium]
MYRRRGYRRSRRRREELRAYMQRILTGVMVICIIIVCVTVAVRTRKATQRVEAETALMQAQAVIVKTETVKETVKQLQEDVAYAGVKEEEESQDSVIIIDPGHGGVDGGCVFDDIVEKDINRLIAAQVVARLREMGYQAELARQGDEFVNVLERVETANRKDALLYVSIHQNSCEDRSVRGIETWYDGSDTTKDSGRLAQLIQQETVRETGAVSRELVSESDLCVTSKSSMPACLIETGFLSNKEEREKLVTKEYRDKLADGIAGGIHMYLNSDE